MKNPLIASLILLLFALNSFAQTSIKGTVYSQDTKQTLSFVNIGVWNKNMATISDEKGYFEIDVAATDTLVFSMVGYQTLKVVAGQCGNEVLMEAQNYQLPEVIVNPAKFNTHELGFHRSKKEGGYKGYIRLATFLSNPIHTNGIIEAVHYRLTHDVDAVDWHTYKVRVRVYQRDPVTGFPSTDILTEPVIVEIQRNHLKKNLIVDLSAYQLPFPAEGAFIGLDMIGFIDKYGNFTPSTEGQKGVRITSTGTSEVIYTYYYHKTKWIKASYKFGNYQALNNVRFGATVKFPAQ